MSGNNRFIRPPFIDPVTGIAYDTNNSEFEGYLTKQSLWLRVSLLRYFLISLLLSIRRYSPFILCSHTAYYIYRIGVDGSLY
jgi:hypothetical protein